MQISQKLQIVKKSTLKYESNYILVKTFDLKKLKKSVTLGPMEFQPNDLHTNLNYIVF